jgi:hypothetical protein
LLVHLLVLLQQFAKMPWITWGGGAGAVSLLEKDVVVLTAVEGGIEVDEVNEGIGEVVAIPQEL